ncbi:MAG: phosphopyruvate hydratase [Pseudomonadota bacterium]|nr:phosphopyruvate hydratase [Pseudomonadota bacterium]
MVGIAKISAFQILDSRGNPTICCKCYLDNGVVADYSVPSGASTGVLEAHELRDHNMRFFLGKGVSKAIAIINDVIAPKIIGLDPTIQENLDATLLELDGSQNIANLGANSVLAVSMAVAKAAAKSCGQELYQYIGDSSVFSLPVPFMNILNGGQHASNNVDIQEFMIAPVGFETFSEALRAGTEIYHNLAKILRQHNMSTAVGDEGGFAPNLNSIDDAFELMIEAIKISNYKLGKEIFFAIDVAASEFYDGENYRLDDGKNVFTPNEWSGQLVKLVDTYPIISIEDGMAENDFFGWGELTRSLDSRVQLVGDDLFVTQAKVLQQGIDDNLANAILIKPNQVGTLTGTLMTIGLAKKYNYNFMISHRSGETTDTSIADLAVATGAGQIKTGAPCRGERLAKYNRILELEHDMAMTASYSGLSTLKKYLKNDVSV